MLHAIASGHRYGFDIMDTTGIPDGAVYPALRGLEEAGLLDAQWEEVARAASLNRPARKYYRLSREGADVHAAALDRFPGIAHTFAPPAPDAAG